MAYRLPNNVLAIVMMLVCSTVIFGTWSTHLKEVPYDANPDYCTRWVLFYDFKDLQTEYNKIESGRRDRRYDIRASIWAAIYAQEIVSFDASLPLFTPGVFCDRYSFTCTWPFERLGNAKLTCTGWINLYQFKIEHKPSDTTTPERFNWTRATNRDKSEDQYMSIWIVGYAHYLDEIGDENDAITAQEFCKGMGHRVDEFAKQVAFMNLEYTKLTCQKWIELSGYTEDLRDNATKALENLNFDKFINAWTLRYAAHFRDYYSPKSSSDKPKVDNSKGLLTPKQYCQQFLPCKIFSSPKTYLYFE